MEGRLKKVCDILLQECRQSVLTSEGFELSGYIPVSL